MVPLGYLDCLAQLTVVGEISKEDFFQRFQYFNDRSDSYHLYVITDESGDKIVAAGTLLIEKKFIRNLGTCGHIEDIVVDCSQRGKNLGKILIQALKELAIQLGCYKVILDCEEGKVQFYEKCGFKEKGRQMAFYK